MKGWGKIPPVKGVDRLDIVLLLPCALTSHFVKVLFSSLSFQPSCEKSEKEESYSQLSFGDLLDPSFDWFLLPLIPSTVAAAAAAAA